MGKAQDQGWLNLQPLQDDSKSTRGNINSGLLSDAVRNIVALARSRWVDTGTPVDTLWPAAPVIRIVVKDEPGIKDPHRMGLNELPAEHNKNADDLTIKGKQVRAAIGIDAKTDSKNIILIFKAATGEILVRKISRAKMLSAAQKYKGICDVYDQASSDKRYPSAVGNEITKLPLKACRREGALLLQKLIGRDIVLPESVAGSLFHVVTMAANVRPDRLQGIRDIYLRL